jgi:uncharacterized protein YcfL
MKIQILSAILAVILAGCAAPQVGPTPNIQPVKASNTATRASIKAARSRIHEAKIHAAKGATALEKANDLLSQMLKK